MVSKSVPLSRPDHPDDPAAIVNTLRTIILSGRWTQGEFAAAFERQVAEECGSIYAVASNSGTSGLEQILKALEFSGDGEVICPSYTFIATANALLSAGARPVFADIDPKTFNLDLGDVERKLSERTRAVLLVHQFGIPADGRAFAEFCKYHDLVLVEDAACGLGSRIKGKALGTFGVAGLLSFHPRKVLSTGEGGMILTDDEALAVRARSIGNHGRNDSLGLADRPGHNYRMSEFQAALGLWALERMSEGISRRQKAAARYDKALRGLPGVTLAELPAGADWNVQSYPIRISGERRDLVAEELRKDGIETSPGPAPVHLHPFIIHRFQPPRMPETERAHEETLLLPMFAALTTADQDHVLDRLSAALRRV